MGVPKIKIIAIILAAACLAALGAVSVYEPAMHEMIDAERDQRLRMALITLGQDLRVARAMAVGEDPAMAIDTLPGWISSSSNHTTPGPCPSRAPVIVQRGIELVCVETMFRKHHNWVQATAMRIPSRIAPAVAGMGVRVIHLGTGAAWDQDRGGGMRFEKIDTTGWTMLPIHGLGLALVAPPPPPLVSLRWRVILGAGALAAALMAWAMDMSRSWRVILPRRPGKIWRRPECGCLYLSGLFLIGEPCPSCAAELMGGQAVGRNLSAFPRLDNRPRPEYSGPRVRAWRLRRGWTQPELAARVGVPTEVITRIETGHAAARDMATLVDLARLMRSRVGDLISPLPSN